MAQEMNSGTILNEEIEQELAEDINAQSAELEELNKKVNSWNMALNSKQGLKVQDNIQTQDKKGGKLA